METNNIIELLRQEERKLIDTLAAIRKLQEYYNNLGNSIIKVDENKNDFPDKYDKELTQIQKTYVALRHINRGFAEDVAKTLISLDSDFNEEKAYKVATHQLSSLYRRKKIGIKKHGRKHEYYIK